LQQGDDKRQWYVTTEGQTMVILNADTFLMGSPDSEPDREADETLHRRSIGRKFAISSKEVTKAQFGRFELANPGIGLGNSEQYSKTDDSPQLAVDWYDAAAYCNWLSKQEGIPPEQWCYLPNTDDKYAAGMKPAADYLTRTGYRLPSEAEWEFACRAGSVTSRYYGLTTTLLSEYAWYQTNSEKRCWPVGRLKPNDFGLFDMQGNAYEWCHGQYLSYAVSATEQAVADAPETEAVQDNQSRVLRGGAFLSRSSYVRSANRVLFHPDNRSINDGFPPARTYP
jgi:formylglycine-generating enzyme required for sulfatase activity